MENENQVSILKMQVIDNVTNLGKVKKVENVHYNFAVSKTLSRIERESKDIKAGIEMPDDLKEIYKKREAIVQEFKKPDESKDEKLIDNEVLRAKIKKFNDEHEFYYEKRKKQLRAYRELLREKFTFEPFTISLTPVKISEKVTRDYIPDNISVGDLFNASLAINWGTIPYEGEMIEMTGEEVSRVLLAVEALSSIKAKSVESQKELAIRITANLVNMYEVWLKIQVSQTYVDWLEECEIRKMEIVEQFAKKDVYGEAERGPKNEYTIEDVSGLNMELAALETHCQDIIKAKNTLLEEKFPVKIYWIDIDMLPEDLNGEAMGYLFPFIKS